MGNPTKSVGSWGVSYYWHIDGLKIRCSDHSVGTYRMTNEFHILSMKDVKAVLINKGFVKGTKIVKRVVEDKLMSYNHYEVNKSEHKEIVDVKERISKKGNKVFDISYKPVVFVEQYKLA